MCVWEHVRMWQGREAPLTMAVPRTSPLRHPSAAMMRCQTCFAPASPWPSSCATSQAVFAATRAQDTAAAAAAVGILVQGHHWSHPFYLTLQYMPNWGLPDMVTMQWHIKGK